MLIFRSGKAPRANKTITTVQLARADLVVRAEMGPSVGWNSLLIELFGLFGLQEGLNQTLACRAEFILWG